MRCSVTILLLAAAIAGCAASSTAAAAPTLEKAFGATVVSTYPDGRKAELWLRRDGTYTALGRRGDPSSGRWTLAGANICLRQQKPFWAPFSFCTPVPDRPAWTAKAITGETMRLTLVSGRG